MTLSIAAASDVGCVRANNEDMLLVQDQFIRDASFENRIETVDGPILIAVSDGMGGHAAGELASEFTLQRMAAAITGLPKEADKASLEELLKEQIKAIHDSLNMLGKENPTMQGLGCTFTGLLLYNAGIYLIHVGDSRLYRQRRGLIALLTKDHTLRNMLNDPSIPANKIANSFGGGASDIFFDFEDLTDRMLPNDILLLCSDGLSGELSDDDIEAALDAGADAKTLVNLARNKGGRDNISCIVIRIE
ncbi:MAG: serine/threonine-protein phosphatase [Chitinophagaceae bacterium]|nr:serine/threonine-protein phosphatase [Chitinophagaceae bacterium]